MNDQDINLFALNKTELVVDALANESTKTKGLRPHNCIGTQFGSPKVVIGS